MKKEWTRICETFMRMISAAPWPSWITFSLLVSRRRGRGSWPASASPKRLLRRSGMGEGWVVRNSSGMDFATAFRQWHERSKRCLQMTGGYVPKSLNTGCSNYNSFFYEWSLVDVHTVTCLPVRSITYVPPCKQGYIPTVQTATCLPIHSTICLHVHTTTVHTYLRKLLHHN